MTNSFLDKDNILWKKVSDQWFGRRSVFTNDLRACWIEDTTPDNIKSWWCGVDVDYDEVFIKNDIIGM